MSAYRTAPVVVVAASSARMLAESARRGGMRPFALDLFGDLDTRRAGRWFKVGGSDRAGWDALRMQTVLARLARRPDVMGWVAGGGFEDCPGLMQACAQALPLIGNPVETIAAVKAPGSFFPMLDHLAIVYPQTQLAPPSSPSGWLSKRVGGTGGAHVRRLGAAPGAEPGAESGVGSSAESKPEAMPSLFPPQPATVTRYYQREAPGTPMSLLFLADGCLMRLVGFNRLLVGPVGRRPFVFQGAIGPVALPDAAGAVAMRAAASITRQARLVGLNSMDFLLDGEGVSVLEINPRPSATMDLHEGRFAAGLLKAHVDACRVRALPCEAQEGRVSMRGFRLAHARRPLVAGLAGRRRLQELGWCHDISPTGTLTPAGGPLCTVSAEGGSEAEVAERLELRALEARQIHEDDDGR